MATTAYAICPTCAEVYPAARGCPACDGDLLAAHQMTTARAHTVGASDVVVHAPSRLSRSAKSTLFAAFGISLFLGSVLLVVLQAQA